MSKFGDLVLVLGDALIPYCAADFPDLFKKMFIPGKFKQVILTGNMCTENEIQFFKNICSDVVIVKGDLDTDATMASVMHTSVSGYKISVYNSSHFMAGQAKDVLANVAKKSQSDIVVFGQTHERSVELINDVVCVNPGTVTGAFSPLKSDAIPSFICLSLLPKTITVFSYILENGELSVKKDVFPQ